MKKRIITIALGLALVLGIAGCAQTPLTGIIDLTDGYESKSGELVQKEESMEGVLDFYAQLFRESANEGENTLVSPLSVLCALAMTANGAEGETLAQMEEAMGLTTDELNEYLGAYLGALASSEESKLSSANSIWIKQDDYFSVEPSFLQTNADYYNAGAFSAPFDSSTLKAINSWIEDNTDGMVKDMLPEITEDAVMFLINALAFEAQWEAKYYDHNVHDGEFTTQDGQTRKVDMMHSTEDIYLESDGFTGFVKPYLGGDYAFVALLPEEGATMEDSIASLTGDSIARLLGSAKRAMATVEARLPRFDYDYALDMSELLVAMGMADAFDVNTADFSALGKYDDPDNPEMNIFIGSVLHKAHITVDANGTKAGAATIVQMDAGGAMPPDEMKTVYLDRPFIYMIVDTASEMPIFIGSVSDIGA